MKYYNISRNRKFNDLKNSVKEIKEEILKRKIIFRLPKNTNI
jgi:hypothetical protein